MATASPTPMGSSHFASMSRRPPSRQAYKSFAQRPQLHRSDSVPGVLHARTYSLNDSSDDEIAIPVMKFSAATNALLNDAGLTNEPLPVRTKTKMDSPNLDERGSFQFKAGSLEGIKDKLSPVGATKVHSPYPRRVVRLSGTPSTLRRSVSVSSAVKRRNERSAEKLESPVDLSTPAPEPKHIARAAPTSGSHATSFGSSARYNSRSVSSPREEEAGLESQDYPSTTGKPNMATNQGSVSRYAPSTVGRARYGEEPAVQGSLRINRVAKVTGAFLKGPARRGRRRISDDENEENGQGLDSAPSSQEPESQESQAPESQAQDPPSQGSGLGRSSYVPSTYRVTSGSPVSSKDILNSVLRSNSPPPPTLTSSRPSSSSKSDPPQSHPVFKIPAPRPDLPSAHDQENEAPPTFKRNKLPLMHLDKPEKVPTRPQSMDIDALVAAERPPLAMRSQNTPRRLAPPPPKMSLLDTATTTAGAAAASQASSKRNKLRVNGKLFTRLDCIGRGGSSRVYRVMAENSRFFALKRVNLEDADENAVRGFKGEIDLLRKLESVDRVIRLYDFELNEEKGILSVLMEMGDLDMNKILEMRLKSDNSKFDPSFVRHYWKEMLECLEAVHAHDVVHSDLKPHNFVLVQGRLKLIDFGIANAIQTDETVNVHRETQIGTPNYMSPESLMDQNAKPDARGRIPNEPKLMKLGKPSDIWSLGCILYQMVYGRAPFAHIQYYMQRCQAIINFNYAIEYPSTGVGNVPLPAALISTLKSCLNRDISQRPSATDLLRENDPFLYPVDYDSTALPITEELLGRILLNVANKIRERNPTEADLLKSWPQGYFDRLRKNMAEGKPL